MTNTYEDLIKIDVRLEGALAHLDQELRYLNIETIREEIVKIRKAQGDLVRVIKSMEGKQ